MRWLQVVGLLVVLQVVTPIPPVFQCANGNQPKCTGSSFKDMDSHKIDETDDAGSYLYTLEAWDEDNDTVTFEILPYLGAPGDFEANGIEYLQVNSTSGIVTSKKIIDYEVVHLLRLYWKLTDSSGETFDSLLITVFVVNLNDNYPKFTSERYQVDPIPENSVSPNERIAAVIATDTDSKEGIVYSIVQAYKDSPCNGDIFKINPDTGVISLKENETLDFEVVSLYTICVSATDSGEPKGEEKRANAEVVVPIQDAQDTAPVFNPSYYDREISEDTQVGASIADIAATDGDRGVVTANKISYSLVGGDGKFGMNNKTGEIFIVESLDRETKDLYTVTVTAQELIENDTHEAYPSSSAVNITFQVGDADDENATFTNHSREVTLVENSLPGTFVDIVGLTAKDSDLSPNNVFYFVLGGPDADAFEIRNSKVTGEGGVDLRVADDAKLDYEKYKYLQLEINAQDASGAIVYDTVSVNITLLDQNDETPTFSRDTYIFSIAENSQDELVDITEATDKDSAEFNQITYELFGQGSDPQFVINVTTGAIYTKWNATLDYERQKVYFLTCVASDSQRRGTATVQIELEDENDNPPVFNPSEYTVNVEENKIPADYLVEVTARDADEGENKEISFTLLNTSLSERFRIEKTSAEEAKIYLRKELDFEEDGPLFNLTVIAANRGNVLQMTASNVDINIQDMNDHSPVFKKDVFVGKIGEDAKRGAVVLQVEATDMDREGSANARIDYFFKETDASVSAFRIGISSGVITVNDGLDRDLKPFYMLEVQALDRGDPPLPPGNCSVNITILDVNNKKPTFSEEEPSESIDEDVVNGTLIAMVTASDSDETAELVYSIDANRIKGFYEENKMPKNFSGWFKINQSGAVFTGIGLDREEYARFVVPVSVEDVNATEEQTAEVELSLTILDVNDNAPIFSDNDYEFTVTENEARDTVISAVISATDRDEGLNGEIIYGLVDDQNLMKIDPVSGILRVNGTFDREEMATYRALVVATDKGDPAQSTTKNITISIADANEYAPEFEPGDYSVALPENYAAGLEILDVSATDRDAGDRFGRVTYAIASVDAVLFTINETTGVIMIKEGAQLDRETEEKHTLTITAKDGGEISQNEVVEIIVLDVNDNPPVFTKFEPKSIQETVPVGDTVLTLTATDADQPGTPNSELEYSIEGGSDKAEELFNITTSDNTGIIMVESSLANRVGDYSLFVVVRDKGSPSNDANATILITVTDVNDDVPEITFPADGSIIYVKENATGFVLNVTAFDTDQGINGEIKFALVLTVDRKYFRLVPPVKSDGDDVCMVFFKDSVVTDREEKEEYSLVIEASNKGESQFASTVNFFIKVNDTDDNEPIFWEKESDQQTLEFSVYENNARADIDLVSEATDADDPSNQHIFYFIVNGNADDCFTLNKTSRQFSLKKSLDREKNDTYDDIVIKVTSDSDYDDSTIVPWDPEDNSLLKVTVTVLDMNDNGPIFTSKSYTGGAEYNTGFDSEVIVVKAIDADIGTNADVTYHKISEKKTDTDGTEYPQIVPTFKVDNLTGSVRTLRNFESRDTGYFTLEIEAHDSLDTQFKDAATVSIYLFNEDQQVIITFALSTDDVRKIEEDFKATLVEVIEKYGDFEPSAKRAVPSVEPVIVIDDLQVFTVDNQPVQGRSVMKLHGVNKEDNTIIDPKVIVDSIDEAYDYVDEFYEKYKVFEVLGPDSVPPEPSDWVQWLLVGILCFFVVLVIGLVVTNCIVTSSYKRKLRAATAGLYETKKTRAKGAYSLPNTNKYAEAGSNPVYTRTINEGYDFDHAVTPFSIQDASEYEEFDDQESKKRHIGNGYTSQRVDSEPLREEQEVTMEMYDDSADHEHIDDDELGDQLLRDVLKEYDQGKSAGSNGQAGYANLAVTEI